MMKNLKRNWLVVSKLTQGIWRILTRELESLKNIHFNGLLLTKLYNVWAKKEQGRYVWLHSRLMQCLKENWLVFPKLTWGIWQIFTRALESLQTETLIAYFCQKWKCMSLKFTGELCVMTMKNDAKVEEELTCQSKIDMRNLRNFDPNIRKSQKICTFMGCFLTKVYLFWAKKSIGELFDGTEYWCNICRKNDFRKWHKELSKFLPAHVRKSKNWDFHGILLSKKEKVWA